MKSRLVFSFTFTFSMLAFNSLCNVGQPVSILGCLNDQRDALLDGYRLVSSRGWWEISLSGNELTASLKPFLLHRRYLCKSISTYQNLLSRGCLKRPSPQWFSARGDSLVCQACLWLSYAKDLRTTRSLFFPFPPLPLCPFSPPSPPCAHGQPLLLSSSTLLLSLNLSTWNHVGLV